MIQLAVDDGQAKSVWKTPATVARQYGIGVGKVLEAIHSGELRAINLASVRSRIPRWRIHPSELEAFEARRSSVVLSDSMDAESR